MASFRSSLARVHLLPLFVGVGEALLVIVGLFIGMAWYLILGAAATAALILIGPNRIFRAGVTRTPSEIICRFTPWYDGRAYAAAGAIPLLGVALLGAASAPGHQPFWLWPAGIALTGTGALAIYYFALLRRTSVLRISASSLTARSLQLRSLRDMFAPKGVETAILRELIESIAPDISALKADGMTRQVQITYAATRSNMSSEPFETLSIGPQLTVKPANLLTALCAWKIAEKEDPHGLLDRIEHALEAATARRPRPKH